VFGPVLAALSFDNEADAIALANATDCGLLAAARAENGGTKRSGHGREKGLHAMEQMSTTQTVVHHHG
jgi:aldehyde dehydrogenase (NAD+)